MDGYHLRLRQNFGFCRLGLNSCPKLGTLFIFVSRLGKESKDVDSRGLDLDLVVKLLSARGTANCAMQPCCLFYLTRLWLSTVCTTCSFDESTLMKPHICSYLDQCPDRTDTYPALLPTIFSSMEHTMTPKLLRISISLSYMYDRSSMPISFQFKPFDWARMTICSCIKPHVNTDRDLRIVKIRICI